MLSGVEDDSKCKRGTLLCAPHVGGLKSYIQANAYEDKDQRRGGVGIGRAYLPSVLANQIVPYVSGGRVCAGREAQVVAND